MAEKKPMTPATPSIPTVLISISEPEVIEAVGHIEDLLDENIDKDESTHPGHGSMVLHALMMVAGFRLGTLCPVDTQGSALENLQQTLASATLAARREVEAGK